MRILALDHVLPESFKDLSKDSAWQAALGTSHTAEAMRSVFYRHHPIRLETATDRDQLLRSVISHVAGLDFFDLKVATILSALDAMGDAALHPLFAAIAAHEARSGVNVDDLSRRRLVRGYLEGPRRLPWERDAVNGIWIGFYVAAATFRRGINFRSLHSAIRGLASAKGVDFSVIETECNRLVSSSDSRTLQPFEPDLLGESFFLLFLEKVRTSPDIFSLFIDTLFSPSLEAASNAGWQENFKEFLGKLCRNLANDDQNQPEIRRFWEALVDWLKASEWNQIEPQRQADLQHARATLGNFLLKSGHQNLVREVARAITVPAIQEGWKHDDIRKVLFAVGFASEIALSSSDPAPSNLVYDICDRITGLPLLGFDPEVYLAGLDLPGVIAILATEKALRQDESKKSRVARFLVDAVWGQNVEVIRALLTLGADVDGYGRKGWTALAAAADLENHNLIDLLLTANADPDLGVFGNDWTPLMAAAHRGDVVVIKKLIDGGANPDKQRQKNGWTALLEANHRVHVGAVRCLLENGANPSLANYQKFSPAMEACFHGSSAALSLLIAKGVKLSEERSVDGRTPLYMAASGGDPDTLCLVIEHARQTIDNAKDDWTPLGAAAHYGHAHNVRILLQAGADADLAAGQHGWTALFHAVRAQNAPIVELLLEHANSDKPLLSGRTPLIEALSIGNLAIARILLNAGADADHTVHSDGWTPLMIAIRDEKVPTISFLLEHADPNKAMPNGWTPLLEAVDRGNADIVRMLLSNGANPNTPKPDSGSTPLILAIEGRRTAIVQILLEYANPNFPNLKTGWSPLLHAVARHDERVIRMLFDHSANPNPPPTMDGETPLSHAMHIGFFDLVALLAGGGAR